MLKNELSTYKFFKIEWCSCSTWTTSKGSSRNANKMKTVILRDDESGETRCAPLHLLYWAIRELNQLKILVLLLYALMFEMHCAFTTYIMLSLWDADFIAFWHGTSYQYTLKYTVFTCTVYLQDTYQCPTRSCWSPNFFSKTCCKILKWWFFCHSTKREVSRDPIS